MNNCCPFRIEVRPRLFRKALVVLWPHEPEPQAIPLNQIAKIAKALGVGPVSVCRFCSAVYFSGPQPEMPPPPRQLPVRR